MGSCDQTLVSPTPAAVAGAIAAGVALGVSELVIERVELQVDADEWQQCRLGDVASKNTCVQWLYEWDAAPGDHVLTVRATDGDGHTQTSAIQPPIPRRATGWHSVASPSTDPAERTSLSKRGSP